MLFLFSNVRKDLLAILLEPLCSLAFVLDLQDFSQFSRVRFLDAVIPRFSVRRTGADPSTSRRRDAVDELHEGIRQAEVVVDNARQQALRNASGLVPMVRSEKRVVDDVDDVVRLPYGC